MLAAGLSERMGGPNKMLLEFNGKPLVLNTFEQLTQSGVSEIIVVTGRDHQKVSDLFDQEIEIVFNPDFEQGMTSSIQKGVARASGEAYMICLGDMPLMNASHYKSLMSAYQRAFMADKNALMVPSVNGKIGNPVVFSACYHRSILAHKSMNGCREIVKENQNHLVEYKTEERAFILDIDTPDDLKTLEQ